MIISFLTRGRDFETGTASPGIAKKAHMVFLRSEWDSKREPDSYKTKAFLFPRMSKSESNEFFSFKGF